MNGRYLAGRDAQAKGQIKWELDDIEAALVDVKKYQFKETHRIFSELVGVLSGIKIEGRKVVDGGYCRAAEMHFPKVQGDEAGAVVIYQKNGPLLAYLDEIDKFPVRLNGGDIVVSGEFIYRI